MLCVFQRYFSVPLRGPSADGAWWWWTDCRTFVEPGLSSYSPARGVLLREVSALLPLRVHRPRVQDNPSAMLDARVGRYEYDLL